MLDNYKRNINYLRISVTDRCNFRCQYCMPTEGVPMLLHENILTFDEITEVVKTSVELGVDKIRITGGEPLVRKGIVDLVGMLANISGIKDFGMTTNGFYLSQFAQKLFNAGLMRVNVSLDTINQQKFREITRIGELQTVLEGIKEAQKVGLNPVKINCVIKKSEKENDAVDVAKYCEENNLKIRFIREMDLSKGTFWKVNGADGGDCNLCNRLRLTADGKIKSCLFSNIEYDVRKLGAKEAIIQAIENKPEKGQINNKNKFNNIGG